MNLINIPEQTKMKFILKSVNYILYSGNRRSVPAPHFEVVDFSVSENTLRNFLFRRRLLVRVVEFLVVVT